MPKVVSSQGMTEFVEKGTHQTIDAKSNKERPAEVKEAIAKAEQASAEALKPPEPESTSDDTGLDAEDADLAERAQKRISKKHKELKQAEALANKLKAELDDTETFSKSQYQRAQLAEERTAELEAQLKQLQATAPVAEKPGLVKPDPQNRKFYDEQGQFKAFEYAEELSSFSAAKAVADDRANQVKERQFAEAQAQEALARARVEQSKVNHADWQRVVSDANVQVAPMVAQYMTGSEHIGEIAYYLAKNPEFATRINAMNPLKAIAEIGKLEVQWEKTDEVAKVTPNIDPPSKPGAPKPIVPLTLNNGAGINTDPAKMSPKELLAYTREREVARKRR